ncbi:MAG: LysE family translocator [Desulfovibrio sp.]|nr:MAG: LysE family translocator [Desulfovibrio sp.]
MLAAASFFLSGAVLGLSAGFAPGPLMTVVIAETLAHGSREGLKVALAPVLTDLPIIAASLFVLSRFSGFEAVLGAVSIIGGVYLTHLGLQSIRFRGQAQEEEKNPASLRKGILTNFLSPHPYLFWIAVGGPMTLKAGALGWVAPTLFIAAFYVCIVGTKMGVALVTGRFQALLSSRAYTTIMVVLGALLLLFAALLIRDGTLLILSGLSDN